MNTNKFIANIVCEESGEYMVSSEDKMICGAASSDCIFSKEEAEEIAAAANAGRMLEGLRVVDFKAAPAGFYDAE